MQIAQRRIGGFALYQGIDDGDRTLGIAALEVGERQRHPRLRRRGRLFIGAQECGEPSFALADTQQAESEPGLHFCAVARLRGFLEQACRLGVIALGHIGTAHEAQRLGVAGMATDDRLQLGDGSVVLPFGEVDAAEQLACARFARVLVLVSGKIGLGPLEFAQGMMGETAQQL